MRSKGMGTICKRKGGRGWVSAVILEGKRKYFYGQSRAIVQDRLREALNDQDAGRPVALRDQKLGTFLTRWIEGIAGRVRPGTFEFYTWAIGHIIPKLGSFNVKQLTPWDVEKFLTGKRTDETNPLSARSVRHLRSTLRAALSSAEKYGLVTRNVARLAEPPSMIVHELQPMSTEQFDIWREKIRGHRLEPLFVLASETAFRQCELLGLTWRDIDFERNEITVRGQLEFRNKEFKLVEPKTAKSIRTVPLPADSRALLLRRREEQIEEARFGNRLGLIFTSSIGSPLFAKTVRASMGSILVKAKLPHFTFHSLRHGAATTLLANNVPLHQVAKQLGHANASTTADVYGHAIREDRQKVADVFDRRAAAAAAAYVM